MKEKRPIKVYIRVRPFNEEEKEREEASALEIFKDESRIKVLDERHSLETSYVFDGVFSAEDNNEKVYTETAKPLVNKLLNGINCALLTYGQTGTGKTHTVLAEGSVTSFTINNLFERISLDVAHKYKVMCSFVQVYQDKVYDMLSQDSKDELCLREHPKKGIYVANLSYHVVNSAQDALNYLNEGRKELIIAETKMVRHSSRSHAIFQLCIERRLDPERAKMHSQTSVQNVHPASSNSSDMSNSFEYEGDEINSMMLEEDIILRGKIDICDLAGSERLGKTMAEGVRLSEAKHINSSLLELGNVIYALSDGTKRHIPFRNSTLTRLLQVCLGPQCRTSFIVCVAPTASEAYETRCSLNFGTRARKITNKERLILNVEVDYKILSRRLAKRIEYLENQLGNDDLQVSSMKKNEIEAPITVETQTTATSLEFSNIGAINYHVSDDPKQAYSIPKMEIVMISELMNILFANAYGKMDCASQDSLIPKIGTLLHDLLCVVLSRKQHLTVNEATWTEIDLEQVLKESLDDLDLMREASGLDDDASFQANDIAKYADYVCNRIEERCQKTKDDMRFCLEKFNDVVGFEEESSIHEKMKKLIEFLENNKNTELPTINSEDEDEMIDMGFLSWMVNVHMALRLTLLILHISKSRNGPVISSFETATDVDLDKKNLDTTFESTSAIDEASSIQDSEKSFAKLNSFASLGEYATADIYTKASTPKRGLQIPLCFQNQFYSPRYQRMSFVPELPSFELPNAYGNNKLASYLDSSLWLNKEQLNVSLASNVSGIDSIDDTLHDIEVSHMESYRQRRLMDANFAKIEEKCTLLEDKNSKLMRTLNVIMKENKAIKERLHFANDEKLNSERERDEMKQKFQRICVEQSSLERNLQNAQIEKKRWENEAFKLSTDNHQIRIDMHGIKREVELKSSENDTLREEITELKTRHSLVKADQEFLSKQLDERTMKIEAVNEKLEEVLKVKEKLVNDLKGVCAILEKANEQNDDAVLSAKKRSKSCDLAGNDATFETELFVAIENNIRIETIMNDVKSKLAILACNDATDVKELGEKSSKEGVKFEPQKTIIKPQGSKAAPKARVVKGDTKTSTLRRSKSLKTSNTKKGVLNNTEKDAAAGNQIKGSKIKELMNEKIKIESSYKELVKKNEKVEEELKTAKNQIEMLVNECGNLDHEINKYKSENQGFRKSFEKVEGGEVDSSLFLRTKEIENLEERHQELKIYEIKVKQLELDLESTRDEYLDVQRHARDLERKYDEVSCELQHFKNQSYNQKIECSTLKEHLSQLGHELNRERQRCGQLTVKLAAAKEKYTMHVSKMEAEIVKCAKKLDRYREKEREMRQQMKRKEITGKDSSVNEADSGLMPDQSEDYLDLT